MSSVVASGWKKTEGSGRRGVSQKVAFVLGDRDLREYAVSAQMMFWDRLMWSTREHASCLDRSTFERAL